MCYKHQKYQKSKKYISFGLQKKLSSQIMEANKDGKNVTFLLKN